MSKRGLNVLTTVVSVCPSSVGRLDGRLVKECTEVDVGRGMHTALGEPRCFMLKAVVSNEPCGMGPDNGRPIGVIVADGSQMSRVTRVMCQAALRQGEGLTASSPVLSNCIIPIPVLLSLLRSTGK